MALLLEHGADIKAIDNNGMTMLHHASGGGQEEFVKVLLVFGDLESPDLDGRRPLHLAAREGREKVVRMLLKNKAMCDAQDTEFGSTPLHYAAQNGHVEVVKVLLEGKADPDIKNTAGLMAREIAIQKEHQAIGHNTEE